jgi:predicted methyltransferase
MSVQHTSEWPDKIAEWNRSGLSIAAWCKENGERYNRFLYWRKRLLVTDSSLSGKFVQLIPAASAISLECDGIYVHLSTGFDPRLLEDILSVLKRG